MVLVKEAGEKIAVIECEAICFLFGDLNAFFSLFFVLDLEIGRAHV